MFICKMQNNEQKLTKKAWGMLPTTAIGSGVKVAMELQGRKKDRQNTCMRKQAMNWGGVCVKGGIEMIAGLLSGLMEKQTPSPNQMPRGFYMQLCNIDSFSSSWILAALESEVCDFFMSSRASLAWSMTWVCLCRRQWPHLNIPKTGRLISRTQTSLWTPPLVNVSILPREGGHILSRWARWGS